MQFDKRVEHAGQGDLISQLTQQGGHWRTGFHWALCDGHAFQAIAPFAWDVTQHFDAVRCRTIRSRARGRLHSVHDAIVAQFSDLVYCQKDDKKVTAITQQE
jgi:hypothetical protein